MYLIMKDQLPQIGRDFVGSEWKTPVTLDNPYH